MNARYFIDTNIFVYTFDESAPGKRSRASQLIEDALGSGRGVISYQVVQEFLNVASRKFDVPLTPQDQRTYLDTVLGPLCEVFPTIGLYRRGIELASRYGYSFYDALIIASAIEGDCSVLYTEDLQADQTIGRLKIANPFA